MDRHLERRRHPLVLVDSVDVPELADADRRHLEGSLRLRPGDPFTVSDGAGAWRPVRLGPSVEPLGDVVVDDPPPELVVGFTPVKSQKAEWMVHKLVELGATRIVVLETERSVVRWSGSRLEGQRRRWETTAREAVGQCRSVWLPRIDGPWSPAEAVAALDGAALAEPGGPDLLTAVPGPVLVGPEGGWSATELADRPTVGLPGRILRAETATVVAAALLAARSGPGGAPSGA